jgi:hypothetical protein
MKACRIETTVSEDKSLLLKEVPFRAGDMVEVIVLSSPERRQAESPYPLRGTPIRYDDPTEPVAESDWDVLK